MKTTRKGLAIVVVFGALACLSLLFGAEAAGQQAIDFQLPAVVGNDIKNIKLSDYDGKWRVVCFFPAAFTFV